MIDFAFSTALPGIGVGLILGVTGAGGAVLAVPALVLLLGLPIAQAAPIALIAVGFSAAVGALIGLKQGILRYKAAATLAISGMLLSPLGIWLSTRIQNTWLTLLFAGLLLYIALRMLMQAYKERQGGNNAPEAGSGPPCLLDTTRGKLTWTLPCFRAMTLAGAGTGLLSGLLGVGGGFIIIPALRRSTNLPMRSITATSLGAITLISLSGVIAASANNYLNWSVALPFTAGCLSGMVVARAITDKLHGPRLQQAFAVLAITASVQMIHSVLR